MKLLFRNQWVFTKISFLFLFIWKESAIHFCYDQFLAHKYTPSKLEGPYQYFVILKWLQGVYTVVAEPVFKEKN
jgi:hypothetical protein